MSKQIEVQLFSKNGDHNSPIKIKGRFLGLITSKEFAALVESSELRRKITSVPTKSLQDAVMIPNTKNMRAVVAVRSLNDEAIIKTSLFISPPIDFMSAITCNFDLSVPCVDGSWLSMEEEI